MRKTTTLLDVKGVSHQYGQSLVLKDVTFTVKKGDFVGLIGPNGSGKTTLIKLILGLLPLQRGSISIKGQRQQRFKEWGMIGYVPQKATSIQEDFPATVREVVSTGLLANKTFPKKYTAHDQERVSKALSKVGMHDYQERRIGELSGGEQQRVFIARALISEPELLILDEPTTGVDEKTQQQFYDLLKTLQKEGITIILVSHDLARITSNVNKVASLNQQLEFYGTHEAFCKHPEGKEDHHCLTIGGAHHD